MEGRDSPATPLLRGIKEEDNRRRRSQIKTSLTPLRKKKKKDEKNKKKKTKKAHLKANKGSNLEDDSDNEERSIIEMGKPELKNVNVEGVLPSGMDSFEVINEFVTLKIPANENMAKRQKKSKLKRKKKKSRKVKIETDNPDDLDTEKNLIREQLMNLDPEKPSTKQDASFYPAPKSLEKGRCYVHKGAKPLKCTVCDGGRSDMFKFW